jgi:hypothetical protein
MPPIQKSILALLALALIAFGGYRLMLALRSDEDRMRDALVEAAADFSATRLSAMRVFDPEYRSERGGFSYAMLQNAMRYVFFQKVDSQTKRFRWRAQLDPEAIDFVELDAEAGSAKTEFEVTLEERSDSNGEESWQLLWKLRIEATWRLDEDEGWRILSSREETLEGRRPR